MFAGRSLLVRYSTPDDEVQPGQIESLLYSLFERVKGPVVISAYNFSLPQVWQGIDLVRKQGHILGGVLDHTQFAGPSCQKLAQPDIANNPGWWKNQWLAVGTTQFGQIEHKKVIVFNALVAGYTVPDGDFDTLDHALDAGYPITWTGSWNFSARASEQANEVFIIPSKVIAREEVRDILAQRDAILTHHQSWQPIPLPTGAQAGILSLS